MEQQDRATIADLHRVQGQAELINGRIIRLPGHGVRISRVVGKIARSLHEHEERVGVGEVHTSTLGYAIPMLRSGRESFCADVSYYIGTVPENPMAFIEGPPTLAVEIRDEQNSRPAAEAAISAKRADYFEAGTRVVWDVDPIAELIHVYRIDDPTRATTYARGGLADAEPAVPGWRIAVGAIFG